MPGDAALLAAGAAIVAAALAWRGLHRRRIDRHVRDGLRHPEPTVRVAAVADASAHGLRRHGAALRALVEVEDDWRVLEAVAAALARHRWEPAGDADVERLRRWADAAADDLRLRPLLAEGETGAAWWPEGEHAAGLEPGAARATLAAFERAVGGDVSRLELEGDDGAVLVVASAGGSGVAVMTRAASRVAELRRTLTEERWA